MTTTTTNKNTWLHELHSAAAAKLKILIHTGVCKFIRNITFVPYKDAKCSSNTLLYLVSFFMERMLLPSLTKRIIQNVAITLDLYNGIRILPPLFGEIIEQP